MKNDGLFGNILKIAGAGAILYGVYKLGEHRANQKIQNNLPPEAPKEKTEEEEVIELINEMKRKPKKTRVDRNNIDLLEIKLKQIRKNNDNNRKHR
jgi:hypothetical protein